MNPLLRIVPFLLLCLLAACGTTPSASAYLERNVSVWNSLIAEVNQWSSGPEAERLDQALQTRKGLADFRINLGNAHGKAQRMRDEMKAYAAPEDAQELHGKLVASLDAAVLWYGAQLELSGLPDGFGDEQAQPLLEAVDATAGRLDSLTDELDQAQNAYAGKHGITLHTSH